MKRRYALTFIATILAATTALAGAKLLWSYTDCNGVYASADLGDINSDGVPDVVCGKYYSDDGDELFALSGKNGSKLWAANDCLGLWGTHGLDTVEDLNGDGIREVIMGTPGGVSEGRSFYLKSGKDGTTIFTYSTYSGPNAGWVHSVAGTGDVNKNGKKDLLAAAGGQTSDPSGTVFCFDGGSTTDAVNIIWTFRPPRDGAQCVTAIADVTGDGVADVVAGAGGNSYDNKVYGLNGTNGAQIWQYDTGGSVSDVVVLGDLNGDGYDDVAAGGYAKTVVGLSGKDGSLLWTNGVGAIVMDLERLPDVNGDGKDDVVVGSWSSNLLCVSGKDGATLWTKPVAADVWSVDVVEDVDGDELWEAVGGSLGSGSGVAKCYSNKGDELWTRSFSERIYDVERVGDVTGDGVSEVCVCLQDKGHEAAHVWLFDVKGDTGVEEGPPHAPAPRTPYAFALEQARPNPCRGDARIAFTLAEAGAATMELYDISGRKVRTLLERPLAGGEHDVAVGLAGLAPGVYIYRLRAGVDAAAKRLVVAR
ncbi:MAG TPA: FG-GAP-like repeat-containing protein [bacterium]|nr:FG-GAP-like repeat-containing protein [bacterium]